MKLISHRGNIQGRVEYNENKPDVVLDVLQEFHVEIDVWYGGSEWHLGHDFPKHKVSKDFFSNSRLWCHCKNKEALNEFTKFIFPVIYFWHQYDDYTITSNGYIWTYVGKPIVDKSIIVLSEQHDLNVLKFKGAGVCSDYIKNIKLCN